MNLVILLICTALAILASHKGVQPTARKGAAVTLLLVLVLAPIVTSSTSVLFDVLAAMCIAYGWNFIGGYTGYASFGNAAYLGLGAYIAAAFMSKQPGHPHWPWFIGFALAVVIVSVVAGAIGIVLLRLKGAYFSIATLGIFIAMPEIINWDFAFGPHGLIPNFFGGGLPLNFPLADDLTLLGHTFSADHYVFYYLSLGAALLAVALTMILSRRKFGYSLVAIRENEEAAEVMGINVTWAKVAAYMLSAGLAALGGAVIGYKLTNMTTEAEALFSTTNNLQMIIICLIGGLGTIWGPCVGAFFLFSIEELLRTLSGNTGFLEWQAVVFSIVIIAAVLLLPRGLMQFIGNGERLTFKMIMRSLTEYRV